MKLALVLLLITSLLLIPSVNAIVPCTGNFIRDCSDNTNVTTCSNYYSYYPASGFWQCLWYTPGGYCAPTGYQCTSTNTFNSCYDVNTSFSTIPFAGLNYYTTCPFGCNSATGTCNGTNDVGSENAMWLTYATGSIFLVLGTILGIPYGKLSGEEKLKGFDTTIVVKYLFFFVGLMLMYLSFGMASRNVSIYGGEANILGGVNTSLLVIMITFVLFIAIFVIEFFFYTLRSVFTIRKERKWEER
jgi:hypothetical protein